MHPSTGSDSTTSPTATLTLEATDVTGTHTLEVSGVDESLSAGLLAQAIAARMELPQNVPWALRNDATGAYLEDNRAVGEQITTEAKVSIVPKAHLG
jgi:hypothetical protein